MDSGDRESDWSKTTGLYQPEQMTPQRKKEIEEQAADYAEQMENPVGRKPVAEWIAGLTAVAAITAEHMNWQEIYNLAHQHAPEAMKILGQVDKIGEAILVPALRLIPEVGQRVADAFVAVTPSQALEGGVVVGTAVLGGLALEKLRERREELMRDDRRSLRILGQ